MTFKVVAVPAVEKRLENELGVVGVGDAKF
jgi:hypothetical protein